MKTPFDKLPDGSQAYTYTLTDGVITAEITDYGATILRLLVPDREGKLGDVALGFDTIAEYKKSTTFFGTVVGRGANRTKNGQFTLNGKQYQLGRNDGPNNLHCGPDFYKDRLWTVEEASENVLRLRLESPDGDQGFPGNATIRVTYTVMDRGLYITYDALCDQDTVFNLTNHCYFNLAGHDRPEKAMDQVLMLPARHFTPDDAENIPTGELRSVEGTPMDFRTPKAIGRDIGMDYDALKLQNGYDHNFEVWCNPCAVLTDPESGRTMEVITDRCGVQFYSGNFLVGEKGKGGVSYCFRGGICLETQFYPDAINHPDWQQPITRAGQPFHSETAYIFK
ncbi:MAG: galactose mutarotase [Ruminococcaceae bacterium]|nr:galactose mutarotase [Oscillospiraceae bacterium]